MFVKYLKTAWRNLLKKKVFSFLNICGVAMGLAVTTLILFWVVDELNYDRFHEDLEQIFSVYEHQLYSEGQELFTGCTPFPLSHTLRENYPEVLQAATTFSIGEQTVKYELEEFKEVPMFVVDTNFFKVFSFSIVEGDPGTMNEPDQIAITYRLAKKMFGDEPAIGKVVKIYGKHEFTIGALVSHPGKYSSIDFDILLPMVVAQAMGANLESWGNNWPGTSLLLAPGTDLAKLEAKFTDMLKEKGQTNTTLHLFPYSKIHLFSFSGTNNRVQYIYQFLAIALIIILIASINYVNASTADAETRRKEVGIRKVQGATKSNLIKQFFYEQSFSIFISILLSILLLILLAPVFNQLSGKTITMDLLQNKYLAGMLILVVLMTLLLSIAYPAYYIASFIPVDSLQKRTRNKSSKISFRSLLVVLQFTLSIILIIGAIVVSNQLKYVSNYDLGYNHENLIYLPLDDGTKSSHQALTNEFAELTGVESITRADKLPLWGGNSSWGYEWQGKDPENRVLICIMRVDRNYFETMGIDLAEGRSFAPLYDQVDTTGERGTGEVLLNREALRRMKMTEPLGKFFGRSNDHANIVGVTEDFHFETLKREVEPMVMAPLREDPDVIIMRISPVNFSGTLNAIKEKWAGVISESACDIGFFDQRLEDMYNSEQRISGLFKYFSFIAIFIACIGLFGLSVYAMERRRKEIGIRKVNGSTIYQILVLLNKDFVKWVLLAIIIAIPFGWFAMDKWLQNFTYRAALGWWIFAVSGILAMSIALLTVSWQSWKAARRNPVEALRYE